MEQFTIKTLLGLLQVYEAGIRELRAMSDHHVSGLLLRLERRHSEVVTAIAKKEAAVELLSNTAATVDATP